MEDVYGLKVALKIYAEGMAERVEPPLSWARRAWSCWICWRIWAIWDSSSARVIERAGEEKTKEQRARATMAVLKYFI